MDNRIQSIRWGIIGVGDVTEVKSGPAFYKIEHSNVAAVMRRNGDKAKDYARRHGIKKWSDQASDLIEDPEIDAIYIATPPDSHKQYAIEAMQAGKPVYVEKPMAKSYQECQEMLEVTESTGMPLWVAYYRRTLPVFLKARELVMEGAIGKPLMVKIELHKIAREKNQTPEEMHWHVYPEIGGAGHFFDLASHQFDYLDFTLGPISGIQGSALNLGGMYPAEDTVGAVWEHKSGIIGSGSWCFVVDKEQERDSIEIIGDKGSLSLPCFSHGSLRVRSSEGEKELTFQNPEHISQNLVQQVVNELRGQGKCVSTGKSAARTSWVLDQVVKEYYAKK